MTILFKLTTRILGTQVSAMTDADSAARLDPPLFCLDVSKQLYLVPGQYF